MENGDTYDAKRIAKANLQKITQDNILGATNAGWCYMFAPLRSYLTNPDFLQALHEYKQKYFIDGEPKFNVEFLEAFFGTDISKLKNDKEAMRVCDIIHTLSLSTDNECRIVDSNGLYDLIHRLEKQYKADDPTIMMNYLEKCTAIMNESLDTVVHNEMVKFEKITQHQLHDLETRLNNGECITVGASENHIYNVYKNNGQYYVTGTNGLNVRKNNLRDAITSWIACSENVYNKATGALIYTETPYHGYYTLSKGEIYDENKRKRVNEYYRRQSLTPAEKQQEANTQEQKEHRLTFLYNLKWMKERDLNEAIKQKDSKKIAQLNKDIQNCVNGIHNFVFKEINNNQRLGNLLNELSSKKNPYLGH